MNATHPVPVELGRTLERSTRQAESALWDDLRVTLDRNDIQLTVGESKRLRNAFGIAALVHRGQFRATGEPAITHPVSVDLILLDEIGIRRVDVLSAGLTHDVIEDYYLQSDVPFESSCDDAYGELSEAIGERPAEWVVALTKRPIDIEESPTEAHRIEDYFRGLGVAEVEVRLIKIADIIHNSRTQYVRSREKQIEQLEEVYKYIELFKAGRVDSYWDEYEIALRLLEVEYAYNWYELFGKA